MSDSADKPKAAIFYAKNTDSNKSSHTEKRKPDGWKGKRKESGFQATKNRDQNDRIETFKPKQTNYSKPHTTRRDEAKASASPWKKTIQNNEQLPTFSYDAQRQRKEETLVYSENSCKAVFKHRRTAIVKAFITQEMTLQFKELVEWLVTQRLGYDIVANEQISKITETSHHGGICLIIKKRSPLMVTAYLDNNNDKERDYVLAIDDVNNPHNLGGLVRTAAFYGINGLMLRQTSLLESGAAMRVAEGGSESVSPIKSDDFVASLDLFKQNGYRVVVLLPCQISSVKAFELQNNRFHKKTVFVIFQRINMKLIECADDVIYLKGNENMASLNISVATGILLSHA